MITRIARTGFFASIAVLFSALLASSGSRPAKARPEHASDGKCIHVGGSIITNFGGVDANTTLGPATGDLRGAVAATLLTPPQPGSGGTVLFTSIGEADLVAGTALRYSGEVCFADSE